MQISQRNISVELLRVLFMLCIVIMHSIIYRVGGAGPLPVEGGNIEDCLRYGLLGLSHIGVSGFIFISGYYGIKFKWYKLWNLWTQALTYSVIIALINLFIFHHSFIKEVMHFIAPLSHSGWFVIDYVVLMVLAPLLQKGIDSISKIHYAGIILFISLMLYMGRFLSFDIGITMLLMLDVYLIGRYVRMYMLHSLIKIAPIMASIGLLLLFGIPFVAAECGYPKIIRLFLSNYNIIALLTAMSLVLIADRHAIRTKYSVNLAPSVLAVYLITESQTVREWLWCGDFCEKSSLVRIAIIIGTMLACMIIDYIRQWLLVPFTDRIWMICKREYHEYLIRKQK